MIWMEKIIGEHTDDQAPVNLTPTPSNLLKDTRREGLGRRHLRDSWRVPLSLPKNAKDGGHVPQLASLRQVAHVLQRILRRAKRKPAPFTQAVPCPSSLRCVLAECRKGGCLFPSANNRYLSFLRIRESVCITQAVHAKFLSAQG